jgi:hypothetical protein
MQNSKSIEEEIEHFFVLKKKTFFHMEFQCIFNICHVDSWVKARKPTMLLTCSYRDYIQESVTMVKAQPNTKQNSKENPNPENRPIL